MLISFFLLCDDRHTVAMLASPPPWPRSPPYHPSCPDGPVPQPLATHGRAPLGPFYCCHPDPKSAHSGSLREPKTTITMVAHELFVQSVPTWPHAWPHAPRPRPLFPHSSPPCKRKGEEETCFFSFVPLLPFQLLHIGLS